MIDRFKLIASAYLFLVQDGQILLARRFQTGYEDGKYGLPSGHLEDGETLMECIVREAKEEIGILIDPTDITFAYCIHRKSDRNGVDFFFTTKKWSGTVTNREPEKCDHVAWFPLDDLPDTIIGYIKDAIEGWQKEEVYQEAGWNR